MPLPYNATHKKKITSCRFLSFLGRLFLTEYCNKSGLWESERNGDDMKLT